MYNELHITIILYTSTTLVLLTKGPCKIDTAQLGRGCVQGVINFMDFSKVSRSSMVIVLKS